MSSDIASELRVDVQYAIEADRLPLQKEFQAWVAAALDGISDPLEVVIRIVGIEESAKLNQTYRGKQGPTNVLSFAVDAPPETGISLLGDLVICGPVVEQEAREQGKEVLAHWAHMVVHGALHLLGYDHEEDVQAERMEKKETEAMKNLGFENPYE